MGGILNIPPEKNPNGFDATNNGPLIDFKRYVSSSWVYLSAAKRNLKRFYIRYMAHAWLGTKVK